MRETTLPQTTVPEPAPGEPRATREAHQKAARPKLSPAETVAELCTFARKPNYQVRATIKERDGARWLQLAGYMLTANASWIPAAQRVNFAPAELDALADAIKRAKAILA